MHDASCRKTGAAIIASGPPLTQLSKSITGKTRPTRIAVATIRLLLALSSSVLLTLSFPSLDYSVLAWIALVPLFVALQSKELTSAFVLSFATGIFFMMGVFYWINTINGIRWWDFVVLGIYFGCYFGVFGLALNFISQKAKISAVVAAPLLWVSMEYLRSHAGFLGLPWALLGHSQYRNIPLIQLSSFTGVYGISFLILLVNAVLSEIVCCHAPRRQKTPLAFRRRVLWPAAGTSALLGSALVYGWLTVANGGSGETITITVIQGDIPQHIKWDPKYLQFNLQKHIGLTRVAANGGETSLIVWPEASAQGLLPQDLPLLNTISALARDTGSYLVVGSAARPKFGSREFRRRNWFNSAFLISPRGIVEKQYDKIYLLPFAEYLPLGETLFWPGRIASAAGHFIPGTQYTLFSLSGLPFGVTICWENIFADHFRAFVLNGARFMVNITNEAWFGESAAPYQFLAMNVFRAVENRISIARSANTGISAFIDPHGRIVDRIRNGPKDIFIEGVLTRKILLSSTKTFYTLYGDVFSYTVLIVSGFLFALSWARKRAAS